ncbi:Penicillin-binding protein 1A [compost metagenome]
MATTPRQPGSTFKSIYYADGLARGVITPATILKDEATDFGGYTPQNATRMYYGNVTVRSALARSLNIPAVKVMQKVGLDTTVATAKRMGITTLKDGADYGLSLAIGSAEVSLIEMTNAYAAYANQGQQFNTTTVRQINNKFNDNIFKAKETSKEVISKEGAYLISNILSDTNARAPMFGNALTVSNRTAAVKTGTTDDSKDAWTIGYTPQIAVGIWVGNNDNAIMQSGGSDMAGPIWISTMKAALEGVNNTEFTVPSGVVKRNVCSSNGGLANTAGKGVYSEYFLTSALPTTSCTVNTEDDEKKAREKAEQEAKKLEEEAKKAAEKAADEAAKEAEEEGTAPPPEEETPTDETTTPTDPTTPSDPGSTPTTP